MPVRFVVAIAKQYRRRSVPLEDLVEEGNVGLLRAAERFDADRGYRFVTYAVWWIRQAILKALAEDGLVRLSAGRSRALLALDRAYAPLADELAAEPSMLQLANRVGMDQTGVEALLAAAQRSAPLQSHKADGSALQEQVADPHYESVEERAQASVLRDELGHLLDELDRRAAYIVTRRFGLDGKPPALLRDLGEQLGVTRERVRQIEVRALQRMRTRCRERTLEAFLR